MASRGRLFLELIRFTSRVLSNPSGVVTLWKTATGGKVVGCLPSNPVPELLHAADLLPVGLDSMEDLRLLSGEIDAWLIGSNTFPSPVPEASAPHFSFPEPMPGSLEEALDRVEGLAEWAGAVSGSPPSEGKLWKSIQAYEKRRSLLDLLAERCAREPAFLPPEERSDIVRAGIFLPPEAHSRLLSPILGIEVELGIFPGEGEWGDPLIVLAKRLMKT